MGCTVRFVWHQFWGLIANVASLICYEFLNVPRTFTFYIVKILEAHILTVGGFQGFLFFIAL